MSISDILAQQKQMNMTLNGVATAVAQLKAQAPAATQVAYGVESGALGVATPVPLGISQEEADLAAAKQDPAYIGALYKMSNNQPLDPQEQQAYDKVNGIVSSLQGPQKVVPPVAQQQQLADLEAAKQDPLYMIAFGKMGNNEPLSNDERQAYDKVKNLEAALQLVQQPTPQQLTPQQQQEKQI